MPPTPGLHGSFPGPRPCLGSGWLRSCGWAHRSQCRSTSLLPFRQPGHLGQRLLRAPGAGPLARLLSSSKSLPNAPSGELQQEGLRLEVTEITVTATVPENRNQDRENVSLPSMKAFKNMKASSLPTSLEH